MSHSSPSSPSSHLPHLSPLSDLSHPLDPLTFNEIKKACDLLKAKKDLNHNYRFACVRLDEPTHQEMRDFNQKHKIIDRSAFICVFDSKTNDTFEAIVNLSSEKITDWKNIDVKHAPYGQPPILVEEFVKCERIVKADSAWRHAMKNRGLSDEEIEKIQVDPFSAGYFNREEEKGRRIVRAVSYYRQNKNDNGYARPIEGVVAVVDLINEKIINLVDDKKNTPIPSEVINYDSDSYPNKRQGLKPISITQPDGPSFKINGWQVEWQHWKLRIGFTPREGLVLHQITYHDQDKDRPIVARASMTDMLVPYGDPSLNHYWKTAFDAGEYGLGTLAGSLKLGCDCKGLIHYFDVPAADNFGNAFMMEQVICMHEEDAGTLWKHNDTYRGSDAPNEVRRGRKLIVSFFPTIGNYEYGAYWEFRQDGSFGLNEVLTGIVQTKAVEPEQSYPWGVKLTPELAAPYHQHFFSVRLEMTVDGDNNSFCQNEFARVPLSSDNPYGTAFCQIQKMFKTEDQAVCDAKAKTQRTWTIFNPNVLNAIGNPRAYKLEIPQMPLLLADETSSISQRGGFAKHNVWVTPYDVKEKYASGDYPNLHEGGNGLPNYIQQKRNIENTEIVTWITFGPTHASRPEDFPVMPAERVGFNMKPFGFFSRNPAMDLPRECDKNSKKNTGVLAEVSAIQQAQPEPPRRSCCGKK
jgi:primary-amine oxidase